MGSIPNTYVTIVRRKDSFQQNFGRHVEACLQKHVDACNAHPRRHPSNSAARRMAGWFNWNFLGRALSSRLQQNMVGWLCCNLCKKRLTLLTVKFDTDVNIPCADTSFSKYVGAYVRITPLCQTARVFSHWNFACEPVGLSRYQKCRKNNAEVLQKTVTRKEPAGCDSSAHGILRASLKVALSNLWSELGG